MSDTAGGEDKSRSDMVEVRSETRVCEWDPRGGWMQESSERRKVGACSERGEIEGIWKRKKLRVIEESDKQDGLPNG